MAALPCINGSDVADMQHTVRNFALRLIYIRPLLPMHDLMLNEPMTRCSDRSRPPMRGSILMLLG